MSPYDNAGRIHKSAFMVSIVSTYALELVLTVERYHHWSSWPSVSFPSAAASIYASKCKSGSQ